LGWMKWPPHHFARRFNRPATTKAASGACEVLAKHIYTYVILLQKTCMGGSGRNGKCALIPGLNVLSLLYVKVVANVPFRACCFLKDGKRSTEPPPQSTSACTAQVSHSRETPEKKRGGEHVTSQRTASRETATRDRGELRATREQEREHAGWTNKNGEAQLPHVCFLGHLTAGSVAYRSAARSGRCRRRP
jgi:hypothetical protein